MPLCSKPETSERACSQIRSAFSEDIRAQVRSVFSSSKKGKVFVRYLARPPLLLLLILILAYDDG
jgi:hypothetical protein